MRKLIVLTFLFVVFIGSAKARTMSCDRGNWNTLMDMSNDYISYIDSNTEYYGKLFYYVRDSKEHIFHNESKENIQELVDSADVNYSNNRKFVRDLLSKVDEFLDGCGSRSNRREARKMARKHIKEIKEIRASYEEKNEFVRNYLNDFLSNFEESRSLFLILSN
jgi:predicted RND superfamily exporter protein